MEVSRQVIEADGTARYVTVAICGAPATYGGLENARRRSGHRELGVIGRCNRRVEHDGDRCWQHR